MLRKRKANWEDRLSTAWDAGYQAGKKTGRFLAYEELYDSVLKEGYLPPRIEADGNDEADWKDADGQNQDEADGTDEDKAETDNAAKRSDCDERCP